MIKAVLFDWGSVLRSKATGRRAKPVYALAAGLRIHGIKTGIVSNIYTIIAKILRLMGDYDGFEPVILSSDVGLDKPDPAIYRLAIEKTGVKAGEIIFVDNRTDNIKAASDIGMQTVLAKNPDQIVAEVKNILSKENSLEL